MPEAKVAFIDPKAALAALTPKPVVHLDLHGYGPTGPHAFDDEAEEVEESPVMIKKPTPTTPTVGAQMHYTNVLDELWPEFDDPEERTAARLEALLEEVVDEAQRVFVLAQELWAKWPTSFMIPESERTRFDKEFKDYLQRLNGYREELADLEPESTATDGAYLGLVKRRQGAGPVPDAIMHLYFAQQLGILADHVEDMSEGFIGRVLTALPVLQHFAEEAAEALEDKAEEIGTKAGEAATDTWRTVARPWLIAGGVVGSLIAGVLGTVAVVKLSESKK